MYTLKNRPRSPVYSYPFFFFFLDAKLKVEDVKRFQQGYTSTGVESEVYSQTGGSIQQATLLWPRVQVTVDPVRMAHPSWQGF